VRHRVPVCEGRKVAHLLVGHRVTYKGTSWGVTSALKTENGTLWLSLAKPNLPQNIIVKPDEVEIIRN
jgi:hypothetical protein